MDRRTRQAKELHAWMLAAETVLLRLAGWVTNGPECAELRAMVRAMEPIRHEWRWLAGVGENPRLAALRAELDVLKAAAYENNGGTGQGAYCLSIGLVEQRIREVEAEDGGGGGSC